MAKAYPVGKAQQMVLDALNMTATDFTDANRKFEEIGITVSSKREGRTSVPVVTIKDRISGGFNADGEGVEWEQYQDVDFSAIEQWIE